MSCRAPERVLGRFTSAGEKTNMAGLVLLAARCLASRLSVVLGSSWQVLGVALVSCAGSS